MSKTSMSEKEKKILEKNTPKPDESASKDKGERFKEFYKKIKSSEAKDAKAAARKRALKEQEKKNMSLSHNPLEGGPLGGSILKRKK